MDETEKINGRPTSFTPEIAEDICVRISNGESLRTICLDEHLPSKTTVFNWLLQAEKLKNTGKNDHELVSFLDQYTRARELQAETFMDEVMDIADDSSNDYMEKKNKSGDTIEVINHEHVQRSKLRVDTRLKVSEKLAPKKYMPASKQEITGANGAPIQTQTVTQADAKAQADSLDDDMG